MPTSCKHPLSNYGSADTIARRAQAMNSAGLLSPCRLTNQSFARLPFWALADRAHPVQTFIRLALGRKGSAMRSILLAVPIILLGASGCVTERVKVGCVRAEKYATKRGGEGDTLGAAIASELGAVNRELGADKIDPATVELSEGAAQSNAAWIDTERKTRESIINSAKGILGQWGPGAAVLSALGGLGAFISKFRQRGRALATVVEGVGDAGGKDVKARIRDLAADYGVLPYLDKVVQKIDPEKDA